MTTFLLDLMQDLREKRLLPVAAALLVAIVAVPVVLARGGSGGDEGAAPPVATQASAEQKRIAALITGEGLPEPGASDFDQFDPKDPFRPPTGYAKKPKAGSGIASGGERPEPAKAGSDAAKDAAGGGGGTATPTPGGTAPGTTGGGGKVTPAPAPRTDRYIYVADVTFTRDAATKRRKGMRRLAALPSQSNPLLIFLGATEKGGNAAFLVDAGLDDAGEGRCEPAGPACSILYLGAGSEHSFTADDGTTYILQVDEIRKVKVGAKKKGVVARRAKASKSSKRTTLATPDVIDVMTVSSGAGKGR